MYSEFTPTCTLNAESFGHLISTEKKIIRLLTDGVIMIISKLNF